MESISLEQMEVILEALEQIRNAIKVSSRGMKTFVI